MDRRQFLLASLAAPALAQDRTAILARLDQALNKNLLGFWLPKSIDKQNGGYHINYGPTGEPNGRTTKMIVTQSRQVWLFSRIARSGLARQQYPDKDLLAAAEHGFRFLRDKMWDQADGGFYWEVDASGNEKLRPKKHMYGNAFGLYALSEFYLASENRDALALANRLFELFEVKAYDREYGGYLESFNADWTRPPIAEAGYMGDSSLKLMNTHLHLLEAMTTYYRASKADRARDRLIELIDIESNAVVRKGWTACTDKYSRDWTPQLQGEYDRVSYGHDIENVWLLMDAQAAARVPVHPFLELYRDLFAYSLKYGWDEQNGGFFDSGKPNQPADRKAKVWWVQAEALVSALRMHRLTRDQKYWDIFERTWQLCDKHLIDWTNGEWHSTITPDGRARGDKAQIWKAGYHNGRALIECMELLKS